MAHRARELDRERDSPVLSVLCCAEACCLAGCCGLWDSVDLGGVTRVSREPLACVESGMLDCGDDTWEGSMDDLAYPRALSSYSPSRPREPILLTGDEYIFVDSTLKMRWVRDACQAASLSPLLGFGMSE